MSDRRTLAFALIASATAIGIAGTDLVLPAVPALPDVLGGTAEQAQLVLASFTAGAALGLLAFGELGARFDQRRLLLASLLAYGLVSLVCAFSPTLTALIALRFVQGAAGAAAAVFAPGMLRKLYGDEQAVRALGLLGSIEALTPALAPVVGAWLAHAFGWRASFDALAILALLLAAVVGLRPGLLPGVVTPRSGNYLALLCNRRFIGHALGYALTLAGLLVFVFGVPTVFANSMGRGIESFIALQISGIVMFAVAANSAGALATRFGAGPVIWFGTALSAAAALGLLLYALAGGTWLIAIIAIFMALNMGLGFRGPTGFHAAVVAARGDDARASALIVLSVLLATAIGTAAVAPFIGAGLAAIAGGAVVLTLGALLATALAGSEQ